MSAKDDTWEIKGVDWDDENRIKNCEQLIARVNDIGFLPFFKNEIAGFSVEEMTSARFWWSGDSENDPWIWRQTASESRKVAYGKFFGGKAGFISLEWLPVFANFRRDGYDFDSLWEEGKAGAREHRIMEMFELETVWDSSRLKKQAGFGKTGERNFSGIITALQMQTYLVISGFRRKVSKKGKEYGMPVSVYSRPEDIWGYGMVTSRYKDDPEKSREMAYSKAAGLFKAARRESLKKVLG